MNELEALILDRVRSEGPMPFAAFMQLALYHPGLGYYARGEARTGWAGHFLTSPELDPVFGELWATAFEQVWAGCDRPQRFAVIEVGPGEGSFAESVLASIEGPFADAISYTLVERVPAAEERQRGRLGNERRVTWSHEMPSAGTEAGVVFSNEVLDNLPVHLVELHDGELLELCVEAGGEGLVLGRHRPAGPELADFVARNGIELREGHLHELSLATESFIGRAVATIERGAVIFVDYGLDTREAAARPHGTLLCYSGAGADTDPLHDVGAKDITVHANWTVVGDALRRNGFRVTGPRLQRRVLTALGLVERDDELRRLHLDAITEKKGTVALKALSRRQALGALADPGGLGGLQVVAGTRGIELPAFLTV